MVSALAALSCRGADDPVLRGALYFHFCLADRLTFDIATDLLWTLQQQGRGIINVAEVESYIRAGIAAHPEVAIWSGRTLKKLASSVLSALRDFGRLAGGSKKRLVAEVGRRGENTFKLLAAVKYQGKQHELDQRLNWWLERLGYDLDVRVLGSSRLLQIGVREKDGQGQGQVYNLKDVGFGLSQVLPELVQCYAGGTGRTTLLEQPELHLDPRAQADLGDLLIDALGQGPRFLIETHSEHLLLRLRRRIAETTVIPSAEVERKLQREQLGVYFVERQDNRSVVSPVEVDELGQTPDPPQGFVRFFSDDYEEVMAMSEAIASRGGQASKR